MSDLSQRSTTDFGLKQSAEDARDRRWESTFFMINVIFLLILFFFVKKFWAFFIQTFF